MPHGDAVTIWSGGNKDLRMAQTFLIFYGEARNAANYKVLDGGDLHGEAQRPHADMGQLEMQILEDAL